ncbi:hypothetical protein Tco_1208796, partial [Tanacetum coccineum]
TLDSEPVAGLWIQLHEYQNVHRQPEHYMHCEEPVFHQRTKHIEIRHHFIRDANEKNLIQVLKIHTDENVADLLTKAFDGPRFEYLVVHIGLIWCFVRYLSLVIAGSQYCYELSVLPVARVVSAGSILILLVVVLPARCLISVGSTLFLLVVIFSAEYLISASSTLFLLVVILPTACLISAGSTLFLLVVILPARCLISVGSTLFLPAYFCW